MAAPSSESVDVEAEAEVQDLGVAADLDTATSRIFFSDDDAVGAESSWPAAEEITSTLTTQSTLHALCNRYGVPAGYTPFCANHVGWAASKTPPESSNAICVYASALDAGLRLPLHGFYAKVLRHYRLAPSQLTPNSWSYMAAFVLLCEDAGVEPLVSVFRYFFTIYAHKDKGSHSGWHHFQPYGDGTRRRLFTGGPLPRKFGWKTRFFFLKSSPAAPWPFPAKWGKPRRADARKQQLTNTTIERLLAGNTGIDLKLFLSRNLPVGSLPPLAATVKVEARAAAAVAAAAESASTRQRKSPSAAVTLPPPQSVFPATSTPPGFAPNQRVPPSSAHGSSESLLPPGMWAADALQLWEAIAEKTQLQDKLRAADAKHAAEVAELKGELREMKNWGSQLMGYLRAAGDEVTLLKEERAHLMDHMRAAGDEVTQLEEQLSLKDKEHAAEVGRLTEEHAAGVARLKEEHAAGVAHVKDAAAKEVHAAMAQAKKDVVLALFPGLDPSVLELSMLERGSQGTADP